MASTNISNLDSTWFDRIVTTHRMIVKEGLIDDMLDCMDSVLYSLGGRFRSLERSEPEHMVFDRFSLHDIWGSFKVRSEGLTQLRDRFDRIIELHNDYYDCELEISNQTQRDLNEEEIEAYDTYCSELKMKVTELLFRIERTHTLHSAWSKLCENSNKGDTERILSESVTYKKHRDLLLLSDVLKEIPFWISHPKYREYFDPHVKLSEIIHNMKKKIHHLELDAMR